jgi:formyltetrahydrofolate deformylase
MDQPKRMAGLVSREDHCLIDLLWRWDAGELNVEIPLIISNHPDLAPRAEQYGIPFFHLPVGAGTGTEQEGEVLRLLSEHAVDLVVPARYMQIPSPSFVAAYLDRVINTYHSFLPAFFEADPYRRAYERGVKTLGATAHYVTEELAAGPIIHQDVAHVTHCDTVDDLVSSDARSSAASSPAPSAGTCRTGSSCTGRAPWSSSRTSVSPRRDTDV